MERDHSGGPAQPGEGGFDEGSEREPDTPEEEPGPDYARGHDEEHDDPGEKEGRYSRGSENPATEKESDEGDFAT